MSNRTLVDHIESVIKAEPGDVIVIQLGPMVTALEFDRIQESLKSWAGERGFSVLMADARIEIAVRKPDGSYSSHNSWQHAISEDPESQAEGDKVPPSDLGATWPPERDEEKREREDVQD